MRKANELRPVVVRRDVPSVAPAVLWEQGKTAILATATIEKVVPPWFPEDKPGGWITANYIMLPGCTPGRKHWSRSGHTDSRGTEIERLIGRSLRAAVDMDKIGPHTITLDCQVLRADGGTRTAAICAGFLALSDALKAVGTDHALRGQLAAVSVGVVDGTPVLDLDYPLDSRAEVDMNIVRNSAAQYVEIQGSAEAAAGFGGEHLAQMLELAGAGCDQLMEIQKKNQ